MNILKNKDEIRIPKLLYWTKLEQIGTQPSKGLLLLDTIKPK